MGNCRIIGNVSMFPYGGACFETDSDDLSAPCHRVVNASGRLVPGWTEQKQLLLEEGISFKQNGCVDLKKASLELLRT